MAVTRTGSLIAATMLVALVAGCGFDKPQASPMVQAVSAVAKSALSARKARRAAAASGGEAAAPVTRADLEAYGTPILQAVVGARGINTLLTPSDVKGNVVTWSSADGSTYTFRDGILIQTRGLGPDLMSALAPSVGQLLTAGGTHQRQYFFLGPDDQSTRRSYDCTVEIIGKETIVIMERSHTVTHVKETCLRPQGSMGNEFWIEGGTVRKSRQLVSGGAGYADFERIID